MLYVYVVQRRLPLEVLEVGRARLRDGAGRRRQHTRQHQHLEPQTVIESIFGLYRNIMLNTEPTYFLTTLCATANRVVRYLRRLLYFII